VKRRDREKAGKVTGARGKRRKPTQFIAGKDSYPKFDTPGGLGGERGTNLKGVAGKASR